MAWFEKMRARSFRSIERKRTASPDAAPSNGINGTHDANITEQINPTMLAMSAPTQEDQYWGRMATGSEEDALWRRLSDNVYMKDVQPSIYLELHNEIYTDTTPIHWHLLSL